MKLKRLIMAALLASSTTLLSGCIYLDCLGFKVGEIPGEIPGGVDINGLCIGFGQK